MQDKTPFEITQEVELSTWNIEDPINRAEKAQRETCRYPLLAKQMGLNYIDTKRMKVADIGAGPLLGVSSAIICKEIVRYDPLAKEYSKYFDTSTYKNTKAEDIQQELGDYDLIISSNCIDHFDDPTIFLKDLVRYMKPGAFFAHGHAISNNLTHVHEAHQHGLTPDQFKSIFWDDFELVWNYDYKNDGAVYGWLKQPAFYQLWRKTSGY